jgi:hypothetical protein
MYIDQYWKSKIHAIEALELCPKDAKTPESLGFRGTYIVTDFKAAIVVQLFS